jgi:hypothetical protein
VRASILGLVIALVSVACGPKYNVVADNLQLETQKKIDEGLIRLESERRVLNDGKAGNGHLDARQVDAIAWTASYTANIGFYAEAQSDLDALQSRLASSGDRSASKIALSVAEIQTNVTLIRGLHEKDGVPSISYLEGMKTTIDLNSSGPWRYTRSS